MADTLRELLERAVALEEKAEELAAEQKAAGTLEAPVVPAGEEFVADDDVTMEELTAKLSELEDTIFALTNSSPGAAEELGDEELGTDFDEFDDLDGDEEGAETTGMEAAVEPEPAEEPAADLEEFDDEKADGWMPCPKCKSTDADVYDDGTARCADCGTKLMKREKKAGGDDDLEDGRGTELETKDELVEETKTGVTSLSEMELLQQRRAALDA